MLRTATYTIRVDPNLDHKELQALVRISGVPDTIVPVAKIEGFLRGICEAAAESLAADLRL